MAWVGGEGTVTTTASSISTLVFSGTKHYIDEIQVQCPSANTGDVTLGPSTVTTTTYRRAVIVKGTTWVSRNHAHRLNTDEIYVIGPGTNEKIIVSIVE